MKSWLGSWWRRRVPDAEPEPPTRFQIRAIQNVDLTEGDLPGADADWNTWPGLSLFAANFNGYQYWGSFEHCFEVSRLAQTRPLPERTLTELRTNLFCLYRAICHDGQPTAADHERAQSILSEIRERVRRRGLD